MGEIGVGLVGYKFMGRAHSNAYRQVARFFDVDPAPAWPPSAAGTKLAPARPRTNSAGSLTRRITASS